MMETFAEENGLILIKCDPVFGGRWGYVDRDDPKLSSMGFKTRLGAYRNWYKNKFGDVGGVSLFRKMKANDHAVKSADSGQNAKR